MNVDHSVRFSRYDPVTGRRNRELQTPVSEQGQLSSQPHLRQARPETVSSVMITRHKKISHMLYNKFFKRGGWTPAPYPCSDGHDSILNTCIYRTNTTRHYPDTASTRL